VRTYARERRFATASTERWLAWAAADRDAVLEVVTRLRLGENQFRGLADALDDIAARGGGGPATVFGSEAVVRVLDRGLGRNDTIHAIKRVLRELRLPGLVAVEKRLAALIRSMALPAGVGVELPRDLEGQELRVVLRAEDAAELRARVSALAEAVAGPELEEIYRLLEGDW